MYDAAGADGLFCGEAWRRFRGRFPGRKRVFLSVIYVADTSQAIRNTRIAEEAGADGVFLINHGIGYERLLKIATSVVALRAGMFVGVNCLDLSPQDAIRLLPAGIDGVWTSDPPTPETFASTATEIIEARREALWDGMFFASGLSEVDADHIDVLTLSELGSGEVVAQAMQALRERFSGFPLAIASDISAESLDALLPHADCVLTTARAGESLEQVDPDQARRLAAKVHAY